jgi:hypothetical protein
MEPAWSNLKMAARKILVIDKHTPAIIVEDRSDVQAIILIKYFY